MKWNWLILTTVAAAIAGGCAVGPNYTRPKTPAPAHWSEPLAGGETNGPAVIEQWWKNFHDPELYYLIDRAVRSNLDLRMAESRVVEARAQFGIVASALGPSVNASGSFQRQRESRNQPVLGSLPIPSNAPFENNVYQAGFDASWEIDVFGGRRRATQAALAQTGAAEFSRDDVLLTLLGDVARNYIALRGYQQRLAIAQENIRAQAQDVAITRDRFKQGLTSDLDVEQASTLLSTTKAEVPALEEAIQMSMHRVAVLLGEQPGALTAELSNKGAIPATPPTVPVGLPSGLVLRRPDVRQAERQLAAATANIGVAKADLYPKFSLTGDFGYESVSAADWFAGASRMWSMGPTMQWKIFESGRIQANIRLQNARQEEALSGYEQAMLGAFEDVENSLVAYAKEQTRRGELSSAAATSRNSLNLAQKLYTNGLTDFVNVLEAERSLYQAQDQLAQSDQAICTDLVSLYKALGGGWQSALPLADAR